MTLLRIAWPACRHDVEKRRAATACAWHQVIVAELAPAELLAAVLAREVVALVNVDTRELHALLANGEVTTQAHHRRHLPGDGRGAQLLVVFGEHVDRALVDHFDGILPMQDAYREIPGSQQQCSRRHGAPRRGCRRQESNLQAVKRTWVTARRTHHLSNDGSSEMGRTKSG